MPEACHELFQIARHYMIHIYIYIYSNKRICQIRCLSDTCLPDWILLVCTLAGSRTSDEPALALHSQRAPAMPSLRECASVESQMPSAVCLVVTMFVTLLVLRPETVKSGEASTGCISMLKAKGKGCFHWSLLALAGYTLFSDVWRLAGQVFASRQTPVCIQAANAVRSACPCMRAPSRCCY